MNVFPLLPLCRQPLPARQQIFAGLRHIIRHAKQLDLSVPRIRIRSLDVIPLSLSLPRSASLYDITNTLDPAAQVSLWTSFHPLIASPPPYYLICLLFMTPLIVNHLHPFPP